MSPDEHGLPACDVFAWLDERNIGAASASAQTVAGAARSGVYGEIAAVRHE